MPKLKINGKQIEVPAGTAIIEAAKKVGEEIPFFCYHEKLSAPANCRQCMVEVANVVRGELVKAPKPVPACYTAVAEGMEVYTQSDKTKSVQRSNMEFLLLNHPVDCPICDQAGECKLQDYYRDFDYKPSRLNILPNHKPKVVRLGAEVVLDAERCILCTRCVRFYEEIVGERPLGVFKRGHKSELGLYPGQELPHGYARNVVDICPVGALTSDDFRFQKRVWFLERQESVCTGCATGCNIWLEHHEGTVWRYRPRDNEDVNECWICDDGAHSYKDVNERRLTAPKVKSGGKWLDSTWDAALSAAADALKTGRDGRPVGVVLSPQATCEDNWAFVRLAREALSEPGAEAKLYWGGKAPWKDDALLKSVDANPNTLGVRLVAGKGAQDASGLKADLDAGKLRAVLVVGHDFPDSKVIDALRKAEFVVAVSTHESPLSELAAVLLPGATHAEKDGVFVNGEGRAQRIRKAMEPKGRAGPEWKIALKLATKLGCDFGWSGPEVIFREIAEQVPAFGGLSWEVIGSQGALLEGHKAPDAAVRIGVAVHTNVG